MFLNALLLALATSVAAYDRTADERDAEERRKTLIKVKIACTAIGIMFACFIALRVCVVLNRRHRGPPPAMPTMTTSTRPISATNASRSPAPYSDVKGRALEDGLEDAVAERGQEQYYYPPPQSPGYDGRSKSPVTSPRAFHLPFRQEQDQYLSKANEKDEDPYAQDSYFNANDPIAAHPRHDGKTEPLSHYQS